MQTYFVMQSPLHVAIIMDGNGRWAKARGLPRVEGHRQGAEAVRRVVEAAPALGITDLTLYAFSSDNWKRPEAEVSALMRLLTVFLRNEVDRCRYNGVRLTAIGRRDRLPADVQRLIAIAERDTAAGTRLHLRLALDYSSREAIVAAARASARDGEVTREALASRLPAPDVDLLIRTASEQRLSDFLLWECAYAEFVFVDRMWPDFGEDDLAAAVSTFSSRERRFGAVPAA
ncbi:MAG TPA: di-trans,poly-cis-decaprenylcistransferase [Bryobacteraceae bacterium]|nr:di-trans,poly-cis-decaprenylcistransferase [Bryobacteraceae bacterium]